MPTNMAWPSVFSQESDVLVLLRLLSAVTILLGVLLSAAAATAAAATAAAAAIAVHGDLRLRLGWLVRRRRARSRVFGL